MKYIAIFILVNSIFKISALDILNNPDNLIEDYPFSLKKSYNEAVIFMNNAIQISIYSNFFRLFIKNFINIIFIF